MTLRRRSSRSRADGEAVKASPERSYFNEVLMSLNLVFRFVPRPLTTAMIARAIPAAIRPYSIAVAPDSSDMNFAKSFFKINLQLSGSTQRFQVPRGEHASES